MYQFITKYFFPPELLQINDGNFFISVFIAPLY